MRPRSSLLQGFGMTGGMFGGDISCQAKIGACQKEYDSKTDFQVLKIIEKNFEETLKGLKETETNLQMKLNTAIAEKKHMKEIKLRNEIMSFFDDQVGTLKDRPKVLSYQTSKFIDAYKSIDHSLKGTRKFRYRAPGH